MTRPYPKLMAYKEAPDNFVVYFATPNAGIVVHSQDMPERAGHLNLHWNPDEFVDVGEDIIIWLTEGSHDPIYQAIAMLEKVNSLNAATNEMASDSCTADSD